jgi:hypothetical protein
MIFVSGVLATALATAPVNAQSISGSNADSISSFLRGKGLTVEVKTDQDGDPLINIPNGESGKFGVYFYNCTAHRNCPSIQFHTSKQSPDIDPSKLNEWNRTHRFARAYLDDAQNAALEMDVYLGEKGMPPELFDQNFEAWKLTSRLFSKFIAAPTTAGPTHPWTSVRAADPQSVVNSLKSAGYPAELTSDTDGDPVIHSKIPGDPNYSEFAIYFYGCTSHRECRSISFRRDFSVAAPIKFESINEWNTAHKFATATRQSDDAVALEMDIYLTNSGISDATFKYYAKVWELTVPKFVQFLKE